MKDYPSLKLFLMVLITGGIFIFPTAARADSLGQQVKFFVDSSYDSANRSTLTATLRAMGNFVYFYVEDEYFENLNGTYKNGVRETLEDLAKEFDTVIYPKERATFGSEWSPGIDNDVKITVLVTKLVNTAGGYFNAYDEFPRTQFSNSNQREMIYLNAVNIINSKNKALLAHEFQHLISFYQKTVRYGLEEDVWLNEARSEYAPTLCGYDDVYSQSYLADRVNTFLDYPTDPLAEWKNNLADYGAINLFIHYLVDHYGKNVLTQMTTSDKVGIESINYALGISGYSKVFSDIFADWSVANYLNDCSIGTGEYCYLSKNLEQSWIKVDYSSSYSGFPNLIISRSSSAKDWSPRWYRFDQGIPAQTDNDTLKLEFDSSDNRANFRVLYIVTDSKNKSAVYSIPLENGKGVAYIPNFSSQGKTTTIVPFNQYQTANFNSNGPSVSFYFTASSVSVSSPMINSVSPVSGPVEGGTKAIVSGDNFTNIKQVSFAGIDIGNFIIEDEKTISFITPAHAAGSANIVLTDDRGEKTILVNAFNYQGSGIPSGIYPDGSLLRAKGGYMVYIVNGNYKRWIQTAELFNRYGHLKWEDIIDVDQSVLNQYQESWLIRADGDKRVYELNADGTKHWLNMTAEQFVQTGHQWNMVYIVNAWERDYYRTGANVMFQ
ncbi:IPT/TIG domain-containing protein [Patescibacteria group bacterium]|nr:IPT/TIG domain-containing protein [Patescibacteria group bacterium]